MDYYALLKQLDMKKRLLDSKKPFPRYTWESLREKVLVEWIYHSNAIEGNTLTLHETKVVLEGITISGKTLHEHLEVVNHREAICYIEDYIRKQEAVSERQIKNIHSIILKGILPPNESIYRQQNISSGFPGHITPDFNQVSAEMRKLLKWYLGEAQNLHAVERASLFHSQFIKIHPFIYGNGCVARLLLNLELMKSGYVPIVIKKEQKIEYYESLAFSQIKGGCNPLLRLVMEILENTFTFYIQYIK